MAIPAARPAGAITTAGTLTLVGSTVSGSSHHRRWWNLRQRGRDDAGRLDGEWEYRLSSRVIQVLSGTSLTMRNPVVSNNTGTNGGGLRINGTATITDSTIRTNAVASGVGSTCKTPNADPDPLDDQWQHGRRRAPGSRRPPRSRQRRR